MFLPPSFRLFIIGLYAFITWKFLSLGSVVVTAGVLASLEARAEALALFPMGALFIGVGLMSLQRLKYVLSRQGPGF